jgi:flagellar hook-basal body complex protein FliE
MNMKITQSLSLVPNVSDGSRKGRIDRALKETNASFGETLKQAVADVNALQDEAGKAVGRMVSGESTDLHEVMIAAEKARTSFDLLMEMRNKAIEAYREIMRMQV